jgi:hypothetical protein
MEPKWMLITTVIIGAVLLFAFFIWRNQKDKKELTKKIIEEDELSFTKEPDTEVDSAD